MTRSTRRWLTVAVALGSVVLMTASLLIGTETLSVGRIVAEWRAGEAINDSPALSILFNQRMPRTLVALIVGCGLTIAGCSFQALLRNPLATPYTLGIDSFGAFGAYAATIFGSAAGWTAFEIAGFSHVQASAFAFATFDVLLIYGMATRKTRMAPSVLLLAGVTLGLLAGSGILFLRYLARPEQLVNMDRWLMGGVDVIGYEPVLTLLIGVVPCSIVLLAQAPKFDQLGFGEEMAAGRGVNVRRLQLTTFLVCSLMTGIIVSKVGPIGFVGLIVPHAVRSITGSRHRVLMPVSMIAGGAFLCACDIIARKFMTGETPIGIITSLIGAPFFLYLLTRRRFTDWET
ncbi:MAG: ABC transporter permease [Candidatus Hydrogenedentota bacterium]